MQCALRWQRNRKRIQRIYKRGKGLFLQLGGAVSEEMFYGGFNFQIWSDTKIRKGWGSEMSENDSSLKEVWIKNLIISLIDYKGNELPDNDIEYDRCLATLL